MRPPSAFQWLIGNPFVSMALMLAAIGSGIGWAMGAVNGWLALLLVVLGATAAKAAERVNAYTAWQREWNGMGGGGRPWSLGWLKPTPAVIGWLVGAHWTLQGTQGDPVLEAASVLFWIASAFMALVLARRWVRRTVPSRRPTALTVSVCLAVPQRSPSVKDAYDGL